MAYAPFALSAALYFSLPERYCREGLQKSGVGFDYDTYYEAGNIFKRNGLKATDKTKKDALKRVAAGDDVFYRCMKKGYRYSEAVYDEKRDIIVWEYNECVLFKAVCGNSLNFVTQLLQHDYFKNRINECTDAGKVTPLWQACSGGYAAMAKLLLEHGADQTAIKSSARHRTCFGCLPLHIAVANINAFDLVSTCDQSDWFETIAVLLDAKGASYAVRRKDYKGRTPIDIARLCLQDFEKKLKELEVLYVKAVISNPNKYYLPGDSKERQIECCRSCIEGKKRDIARLKACISRMWLL